MEVETVNVEEFDGNVEAGNHDMPYVGQQFQSEKDAYNAYNAYALFKGFGIRLDRTAVSQKTRVVIRRVIVCKKEGKKNIREKNFDGKLIENRRRSTRTECKARMILALNQTIGLWSITSFIDDHNHKLTTPSKSGKHRSHKEFHRLASTRRLINTLHGEGMGPTEIATVVNVHDQVGGEIERITPQECHDQSRKFRRNNIGNECVSVINHFMELRNKDALFFFTIELDEEKTLRSVFWADGRSINSYLEFSDVVVFDVTYRTNKFAMPFAPFTSVNHHRQSILFGCALITDETEATLSCSCAKFEMEGMLCRHIFHIMIRKRVLSIPEQYMLKRWSISARYKGSGCNSYSNTSRPKTMEVTPLEQFSIRVVQNRIFEKASLSKEVYSDYFQWMEEKLATLDLQDHQQNLASGCGSNLMPLCRVPSFPSSSQQLEAMPEILVRDLSRAFSTKGRPSKPTRICSGVELSQQHKEKKKVTCSHCNARGHNKVGCPLRKAGNTGNTIPYAEPS